MMVQHDNNHHRSFLPYAIGYGAANGPTGNKTSSDSGAAAGNGGAVGLRTLQQPFGISPTTTPIALTAFKSPGAMMAAYLECPFTISQWKELERQAMIYKYMKASVPVPPDLLISITGSPSVPVGADLNLRFSGIRRDVEPGRCRRTDGKKWRCSRDVAPGQKYCERHMNRGRPRSRKPVEHPNKKKTRHTQTQALPSSCSTTLAQPFHQQNMSTCFPDKPCEKPSTTFWPLASVSSYKGPRNSDWILNEELIPLASSDQQWQHLMRIGPDKSGLYQSNNKEPLNLNSYASLNDNQQRNGCSLFLNSEIVSIDKSPESVSRGFIDAWSNGVSDYYNSNSGAETALSFNGKLSLPLLSLSMGVDNIGDDEMGPIHMGLGVNESDPNHEYASKSHLSTWIPAPPPWAAAASTPGGPLAEVLRPSKNATATEGSSSNPSSPVTGNGNSCSLPVVTAAVSSPYGALQRTLVSLSDNNSSGSSSPTLFSSGSKPEICLMLA